ncbi:MAG: dethiobiotin synthase [Elusimicrobia bacterium]|nr:dethiobiotin synthase [Candidatus Liberimonas magnetica]
MNKGIFITATDTEVGKTYISCLLAQELVKGKCKVVGMKPVSAGSRDDAKKLIKASGVKEKIETVNPLFFKYPLAPYASALIENRKIDLSLVWKNYKELSTKYEFMIVEGIGGLMVPVKKDYYVLDLIKGFKLPVLIVARPGLGTINHVLLTLEALKKAGVKVLGIVINDKKRHSLSEKTNPKTLKSLTGLPVLEVPHNKKIDLKRNKWLTGQ